MGSIDHSVEPRSNRRSPPELKASGDQAGLASRCPAGGVSRIVGACGDPEGSKRTTASCPLGVM